MDRLGTKVDYVAILPPFVYVLKFYRFFSFLFKDLYNLKVDQVNLRTSNDLFLFSFFFLVSYGRVG